MPIAANSRDGNDVLLRVQNVIHRVRRCTAANTSSMCMRGVYGRIIINGDKYLTKDAKVGCMAMAHSYEAGESKQREGEGGEGSRDAFFGASTADNK